MKQNRSNSKQCFQCHGQLPDRERAEETYKKARPTYCGYGQLPDLVSSQIHHNRTSSGPCCHGDGQFPDRGDAKEKITALDRNTVVMASCLTSFDTGSNRTGVTLDSVVMVRAGRLTVNESRRKKITLDRRTVVTAKTLTFFAPSWNKIVLILDGVVMVIANCLTVSAPRREKTLYRITLVMAGCLILLVPIWNRIAVNLDRSRHVSCFGVGRGAK